MQKTVRFAILFVFLCTGSAWAQSSLSISPTQFYVFDVENFLTLSGATLGQESTVVTYTNGNTVITVDPQIDPAAPRLSDVWVPFEVSMTVGHWDVRVIATDADGAPRIYGPAGLEVIERPEPDMPPPSLPEVLVVETGDDFTFDAGGATCNHESGASLPIGTTTVTCTLGSSTQSFVVVVTDTRPPVLTLPTNITSTEHTVTFTASATDNIDGAVDVNCEPPSGSAFPDGETTVQCVAQDAHANYASGAFTVTVATEPPPVLHLPADITREATGAGGAVVTYAATADGGTIQCAPASGALFPIATTTVNCSATNVGGTSTGSFHVSVVDTTPPTLFLPTDITAEATSPSGAVVTYLATATDIVDGNVAVSCSKPSGSTFPLGTTTVQCSAIDAHLNPTNGSFTVTVADATPPTVSSTTPSQSTMWPPNHKMRPITIAVVASDAVDPHPASHIVSVSSNQPPSSGDWVITGALTVDLRAERTGSLGARIYTITVATSDASGNTTQSTCTVTVPHDQGH